MEKSIQDICLGIFILGPARSPRASVRAWRRRCAPQRLRQGLPLT
jgi:hypothetical protein